MLRTQYFQLLVVASVIYTSFNKAKINTLYRYRKLWSCCSGTLFTLDQDEHAVRFGGPFKFKMSVRNGDAMYGRSQGSVSKGGGKQQLHAKISGPGQDV